MNKYLVGGSVTMVAAVVVAIIMMAVNGWVSTCDAVGSKKNCQDIGLRTGYYYDNNGDKTKFDVNDKVCKYLNPGSDVRMLAVGRAQPSTVSAFFQESWAPISFCVLSMCRLCAGITGFIIFLVAMVLLIVAHRHAHSNYRYAGLLGLYICSLLMTLGIIFYSDKMHAGYSFILMIVSGQKSAALALLARCFPTAAHSRLLCLAVCRVPAPQASSTSRA
jgi:hypothetical protein